MLRVTSSECKSVLVWIVFYYSRRHPGVCISAAAGTGGWVGPVWARSWAAEGWSKHSSPCVVVVEVVERPQRWGWEVKTWPCSIFFSFCLTASHPSRPISIHSFLFFMLPFFSSQLLFILVFPSRFFFLLRFSSFVLLPIFPSLPSFHHYSLHTLPFPPFALPNLYYSNLSFLLNIPLFSLALFFYLRSSPFLT